MALLLRPPRLLLLLPPMLLLLLLVVVGAEASVHHYSGGRFELQGNAFVFFGGSEGLYASSSRHSHMSVANGRSYIRFDQSLQLQLPLPGVHLQQSNTSSGQRKVQAVVLEMGDRDKLGGSAYGGLVDLCCTRDLSAAFGCREGDIIVRPAGGWPQVVNVGMSNSSSSTSVPFHEVDINKTGLYVLFFVHCDPSLEGLSISGRTVWKNPSGYLPGRMAPLLTFYALMCAAYLLLGLAWTVQYMRFWRDILQLQNCMTLVIGLGMAEMAAWYFDYANFNLKGSRPVGITLCAVTLGVVKRTLSRLLILVVSMGYGVVQPTLGGLTSKVLFLGGAFLLASQALDVVEHVGRVDEVSYRVRLLLVLPVAVLDAFFVLWIFSSLSRTLEKLQAKRQSAKLELYRTFANALAIAVAFAIAWIGFELYYKATDTYGERWRSSWTISAFWNVLAFAMLCVMCALWAPSQNAKRYAYAEDWGDEEEEGDEAIPLTAKVKSEALKPERKEKKIVNTDVFRLEVDDDDNGNEGAVLLNQGKRE